MVIIFDILYIFLMLFFFRKIFVEFYNSKKF